MAAVRIATARARATRRREPQHCPCVRSPPILTPPEDAQLQATRDLQGGCDKQVCEPGSVGMCVRCRSCGQDGEASWTNEREIGIGRCAHIVVHDVRRGAGANREARQWAGVYTDRHACALIGMRSARLFHHCVPCARSRCLLTSPWIWRVEVSLLKSTRSRLFPPSSHGVCARGGAPCCLVLLTSIMHNADTPGVCSAQRVARLGEAGRRVPGKGEHTGAVRRGCCVWRCTATHGRL